MVGANSIKDNKPNINEISNKLSSSSQPLSLETTLIDDLAGTSTSTNAPLPIIGRKSTVVNNSKEVTISSSTITSSATVTNTLLESTNVNIGKLLS